MREKFRSGIDWVTLFFILGLHGGCLLAPVYFTWQALIVCGVLAWLTSNIGVCVGYHRCLTHNSFHTYSLVRWTLAFIGQLSAEGTAIHWVATHWLHHVHSDQSGKDPHSPVDGLLWSHMLWFLPRLTKKEAIARYEQYAPKLYRDPVLLFLHRTFLLWHIILGLLLFNVGVWGWDFHTGVSFVVWGMFVRTVVVMHGTWFVNSATHWPRCGYRNYETPDRSRNSWWVALLTWGEGWHNNHHAAMWAANHGHKWWEIDVTYRIIWLLQELGIVWNVKVYPHLAVPGQQQTR